MVIISMYLHVMDVNSINSNFLNDVYHLRCLNGKVFPIQYLFLGGSQVQKILAVYDMDVLYTTRFLEYFKNKKDIPFEIIAFTMKEKLEEFLQCRYIDILILGNSPPIDGLPLDQIKFIYHLSEEPNPSKNEEGTYIFKYQSAHAVMSEIISIYSHMEPSKQSTPTRTHLQVMSIFSPISSVSKLAFSWSISFLLSNHRKTLFIPMEYLPHRLLSILDQTSQSLSEFIYYLKENTNLYNKLIEQLKYRGNLAYLFGLTHGFDLQSLSREDMITWIEAIRTNSDYHTIIFYSNNYNEAMLELLRLSDKILITSNGTLYETAINNELERQMERAGYPISEDKYQIIKVIEDESLGQEGLTIQELQQSYTWSAAEAYVLQELTQR
jgi:hypothetical protein